MSAISVSERDCVIAGGGPGGMVLGYLLARAGLRVSVLEKHADFLRDFRGDTIHPSTITLLRELGLRERFLELPLTRLTSLNTVIDGERLSMIDFSILPEPDNFLVLAPQWEFLNFLVSEAEAFSGFELRMSTRASDLIIENGRTVGVRAMGPAGEVELRAPLTVAADGRDSTLREAAGLHPVDSGGVPIDVLWFRLPKPGSAPPPTLGYLSAKGMGLTLDRGDYYQAGMIIPKGGLDALKTEGIAAFRNRLALLLPHLAAVAEEITEWDQIKLLSVQLNRLDRWHRSGFIAIGDAAHAMSPVFGVGVNYAIQDAVALANAVQPELARGVVAEATLEAVQRRREKPVKRMQRMQRRGHRVMSRQPRGDRFAPKLVVGILRIVSPLIRRLTSRVVGIGFLAEHPEPHLLAPHRER